MTTRKFSKPSLLISTAIIFLTIILSLNFNIRTIFIEHLLNIAINTIRYTLAAFFIVIVLVLREAELFKITKKNRWALFYLGLTGLACLSILIIPGLNHSNILRLTLLALTNPVITVLLMSTILKNPARFGRRTGMFFSLFGMLAVLI